MGNAICKIEGMVPLLQNRFPMPDDWDEQTKKRASKGKKDRQTALLEKAYYDKKGVYMPVDCIRMMLIGNKHRPGAAKILGSNIESKKGSLYLEICKSCVYVEGIDDPTKVYFGPNRKTWDSTDIRSIVNAAGSRSIVERPQINTPWSLEFRVVCYDVQTSIEKIKEMFEVAGLRCGLGNYGPTFGRFRVVKWKEEDE